MLNKVKDDQFTKTLQESRGYIAPQLETPKDTISALRGITYYLIGKDWVTYKGKNWMISRDKMIEYLQTPKIRKILFEKSANGNKALNSNKNQKDTYIIGQDSNLWKMKKEILVSTIDSSIEKDKNTILLYKAMVDQRSIQFGDTRDYIINEGYLRNIKTITNPKNFAKSNNMVLKVPSGTEKQYVSVDYNGIKYYVLKQTI